MHDEAVQRRLGFKLHQGGTHTSRTIMLDELTVLLDVVPADASLRQYRSAIREQNCLAKRSGRTRALTARHLTALYGLSLTNPVYAGLHYYWFRDIESRAQLALIAATARDTLLREVAPLVLKLPPGTEISRDQVEALIADRWPGRFSAATLKSTAQNVNGSLTKSGHLRGRIRKFRCRFQPTMGAAAYALYLGWLRGERGELLLQTEFCKLLGVHQECLLELAARASARGWLVMRRVDKVVDLDFPDLQPIAEAARNSASEQRNAL